MLADFDLRKPQLGNLFSVPVEAAGVTEVLRGKRLLSATLWPIALGVVGTRRGRVPTASSGPEHAVVPSPRPAAGRR